jgi:TolA-binding protein
LASPEDYLSLAKEMISDNKTANAADLYREVLRRYPGSEEAPEAQLRLAYLREKEDSEGSKEEFRKVFEDYPESGQALDALYHLGFMEFEAGEIESASDCYSALIARPANKYTASTRIMRAKCSLKQRKPEAALPDLAKAAKEGVASGKHFEAQRLLAETWMENKDRLPALSGEVRTALPDALYLASDVYLNKREKPEEALPFLVELTDNYPEYSKRSGALFWRGAALIRTGRREEAARVYEEIVEKYPDRDHAIGAQQELVRLAHDAPHFEATQKRAEKLYAYPHIKPNSTPS